MLEEDFLKAIVKGDSQRVVRLLGQITNTGPLKVSFRAAFLLYNFLFPFLPSFLQQGSRSEARIYETI